MWKEKIFKAYNRSWLEEINNKEIDFMHKTVKKMLNNINKQLPSLTNKYKEDQLKETDLQWNPE